MRGGQTRGQMTLFVILGLVLLIIIGLLFLLLGRTSPADTSGTLAAAAQNRALNEYVQSCLDASVAAELRRISATGGLVRPARSGIVPEGAASREVIYGITTKTTGVLKPVAHQPPRYPDWGITVPGSDIDVDVTLPATPQRFEPYQDGYFGDVKLPGVCSVIGPNAPMTAHRCRSYPAPPFRSGPSLQEQMVSNVTAGMVTCVDPSQFRRAIGKDVAIAGAPVVEILFTEQQVLVNLTYNVTMQGQDGYTTLPFSKRYDVRLRPLAEFAIDVAREDTRDVQFNITHAPRFKAIPSYRDGFNVTKRPVPGLDAELITISDNRSRVSGATYNISFLREMRHPMISADTDGTVADTYGPTPSDCCLGGLYTSNFASPDELRLRCLRDGDLLIAFIEGHPALRDCIKIDWAGNPQPGPYSCPLGTN